MMTNVRMTKSISTNTVSSIVVLLTREGQSPKMKNHLIKDIKNRISHMNLWSKYLFLKECIKKRIATKEIEMLAKRVVYKFGAKQKQRKE